MIKIHPNLINFVRPSAHSKYSPSSADRWLGGCVYSMKASEGIVEEESDSAAEGTLAHLVCEAVYRERELGIPIPVQLSFDMLALKDKGDEMMAAAHEFFAVVDYWMKNTELVGDILWFGQERGIPVFPEKDCYGTGDFIIVGSKASVVIDFKYGRKPVKADSVQLKVYAAGIARHIDNAPTSYKFYAVIHQPRVSDTVKEHSYTIAEMYDCLKDIWHWIHEAEKDTNEPIEGSHCFWCPARRTKDIDKRCKLIMEKPLKLAQENFAKFMADSNLTPDTPYNSVARDEAIIKLMTLLPAIEEVVNQSKEDFLARMQAGQQIPGITVSNKLGNRKFNSVSEEDTAAMIKQMFPSIEPYKVVPAVKKLRTLSDLEKEVGKGKLDPVCVRPVTTEVQVLDEKARSILSSMSQFAKNISLS